MKKAFPRYAWHVAVTYAIIAALWVIFSDQLVHEVFPDPDVVLKVGVAKGTAFVIVSAIIILVMVGKVLDSLRASELSYARLFESARDAIIVTDRNGRIEWFNRAAEELLGASASTARGLDVRTFLDPPPPKMVQPLFVSTGHTYDGCAIAVEASVSVPGSGPEEGRTYIVRDVRDRMAYEREIKRLNRLYDARSRINKSMAVATDATTFTEQVCSVLREQGGIEHVWMGPVDEVPTMEDPDIRSVAVLPIYANEMVWGELRVQSRTMGYFQESEIDALSDIAADVSYALDAIHNAKERDASIRLINDERAFSNSILENVPGLLFAYDEELRLTRWNRNMETVTGYSSEELLGMHPGAFFRGEQQTVIAESIDQIQTTGSASKEAWLTTKDGSRVPYSFSGFRSDGTGHTGFIGIGVDISERIASERELRQLNSDLERLVTERTEALNDALLAAQHADAMKSAFLATMSHELRTPLNSIIGFSGILLNGLPGDINTEQAKQLGMVRNSARHLLELINDVLDISKIEAGELAVYKEPVFIPALVSDVVNSVSPQASMKHLILDVDVDVDVDTISTDERRLRQILVNLVNNAVKFTEKGRVAVHGFMKGRTFVVDVQDTGVGIEAVELPGLFTPFHQVENGFAQTHEGTGLGLAISHRLAALLGGTIAVTSEPGVGSMFTLTLPP